MPSLLCFAGESRDQANKEPLPHIFRQHDRMPVIQESRKESGDDAILIE